MIDVIFWNGFCFGVAITAGFYCFLWLIFAVKNCIKKPMPLKTVLDERVDYSEAIKEFVKRLKEKSQRYPYYQYGLVRAVPIDEIDNAVKEMVGE